MFSNDKVLVLVHEQQGAVGDLASVVVHLKAVGWSFGCIKPGHVSQPGTDGVCQVLHSTLQ